VLAKHLPVRAVRAWAFGRGQDKLEEIDVLGRYLQLRREPDTGIAAEERILVVNSPEFVAGVSIPGRSAEIANADADTGLFSTSKLTGKGKLEDPGVIF